MLEQPQQPKVFVEGNTASFPPTILAQSFPLVQDITTGSPSFGNFIFTHYAYRQRQANVSLTWVCACARYRGCATVGFSSLYAAGWQWTWPKASSAGGSERMQIYLGAVADLQMNLLRSPLSLSLSLFLCLAVCRTWGPVEVSPFEILARILISKQPSSTPSCFIFNMSQIKLEKV